MTSSAADDRPGVRAERRGRLGLLTLDRPEAINALTLAMVRELRVRLDEWAGDDRVATVAITGAGERGLCAGGDVVALLRDVRDGDGSAAAAFWREEYRLNAAIARYPKPIVAVQDGVVLGGGVGISSHASHPIATERTSIGLPEVRIGFVPDVGATWLLARAPGELGTYAALTGDPVGAGDAIALGLSGRIVPSARIPELLAALETVDADAAIDRAAEPAPSAPLAAGRAWIDPAFAGDDPAAILDRLRRGETPARAAADAIAARSPVAVAVTLEALRRARRSGSLEECLVREYRVSMHALRTADFAEGIRAQLVDKDRSPAWTHRTVADVAPAEVAAYFEPPATGDLEL